MALFCFSFSFPTMALFSGQQLLVGPTHWAMFSPSSGPGLPSWQERDVGLSADIKDVRSSHTSSSLSEAMNVSMVLPQKLLENKHRDPCSTFPTGKGSGGGGSWEMAGGGGGRV